MTAPTLAAQALDRLDDGLPISTADRRVLAVFDEHCRWGAQRFCLICGAEGQGSECDRCVIAAEVEAKRTADQ
jgi:hypothetical protein